MELYHVQFHFQYFCLSADQGHLRQGILSLLLFWYFVCVCVCVCVWPCRVSKTEIVLKLFADSIYRAVQGWVCGRSIAECGFESRRGHGFSCVAFIVCSQVEVSASGWSLVQRSPTECGVSECDREASLMRRPWPARGLLRHGKKDTFSDKSDCYLNRGW